MIETYDFSLQCDELTDIQLAALNAGIYSIIYQLQKKGTLPLTVCFMKAEAPEYEVEFIPDGLEGMEPGGSA